MRILILLICLYLAGCCNTSRHLISDWDAVEDAQLSEAYQVCIPF
jgi:hypothetical protein